MRAAHTGLLLLLLLAAPLRARAAVPEGFEETRYRVPGLTATGLAWAPDGSGRLFLLDKEGTVYVATLQGGALAAPDAAVPLARWATESVFTNSECGLLGIAFDPDFATNRFVYLFLTASASAQRIVRYTDAGGEGTARTVLIDGLPTRGQNHDGGGLGFGPDGKLYWAIGDLGAGVGVNEDLSSLAAKVGRANRDGTPVQDNPFFDGAGPHDDFIWARGFRNPFTLTFEPGTGRLWVNSVGTLYEQVFTPRAGDHAGYNRYENDQPEGFLAPLIKYRTNGTDTRTLSAAQRAGGTATFTTASPHGFRKGERLRVAGVSDASFDADLYVTGTPSATTWTAAQPGPDAQSSGGSATTQALGGSLTGGTFYDATLFPADYRGNFLFGDFNSGTLTRVRLAADGSVAAVDAWASGFPQQVDLAVGPDGALYAVGVGSGTLTRVRPVERPQRLVLSALHLLVPEGGRAIFSVQLAQAPAADVRVDVARTGGEEALRLAGGAQLTFTPGNWNVPQAVTLEGLADADGDAERAQFSVTAAGLASETLEAQSIEAGAAQAEASQPETDVSSLVLSEGGSATFGVLLASAPTRDVLVTVQRTAGDADVSVTRGAELTFTPANWSAPQQVEVTAAEDADAADDVATLSVTAPGAQPRTVSVTVTDDDGGNDESPDDGCGCGAGGPGAALGALLLARLLRRRR